MTKKILTVLCLLLLCSSCSSKNDYIAYSVIYQAQDEEDETHEVVFNGDYVFPLINTYTFTNGYGVYNDGSGSHYGVDLHTTLGNKALSVSDGVVVEVLDGARDNPIPSYYDEPPYANDSIRGNYVTVQSTIKGEVLYFRYMHFHQGSIIVAVGNEVKAGQQLAEVGNSGYSWGAHLHFEVRIGLGPASIDTLDPTRYIDFGERGGTYDPKTTQH